MPPLLQYDCGSIEVIDMSALAAPFVSALCTFILDRADFGDNLSGTGGFAGP